MLRTAHQHAVAFVLNGVTMHPGDEIIMHYLMWSTAGWTPVHAFPRVFPMLMQLRERREFFPLLWKAKNGRTWYQSAD